jgi:hypothetical protein
MKMYNSSTFAFLPRTGKLTAMLGLTMNQRKRCLVSAALVFAACAIGQKADAQTTPTTPINSCGTVISTPGVYVVTKALQSDSETVDCIQINSPGVGLQSSHQLTGPGGTNLTAAGIRVTSKATGVWLALTGATIQGFGVGIVVEGSGVSIDALGGSFTVQGNAAQGVLISNATNVTIGGLNSTGNGQAGLELSNASGVIVEDDTTLDSNGSHGLWVNSSSGNLFSNVQASGNEQDGFYVGETDPTGKRDNAESARPFSWSPKPCPACIVGQTPNGSSQHNVFVAGAVINNHGSGIAIGAGDSSNIVTGLIGEGNSVKDATDESENCTNNTWTKNEFSTVSPSCIH